MIYNICKTIQIQFYEFYAYFTGLFISFIYCVLFHLFICFNIGLRDQMKSQVEEEFKSTTWWSQCAANLSTSNSLTVSVMMRFILHKDLCQLSSLKTNRRLVMLIWLLSDAVADYICSTASIKLSFSDSQHTVSKDEEILLQMKEKMILLINAELALKSSTFQIFFWIRVNPRYLCSQPRQHCKQEVLKANLAHF